LTDYENSVFHLGWLAWKDINQSDFSNAFNLFWTEMTNEIENFCKQCGFPVRLSNSRIALTLNPKITLAFSPIANGYLINIWHLLFRNNQNTIYFNPLEFMACGFVHEESHRKFFQEHDMLGREKETENFSIIHFYEFEKNAILEEIRFIENAKKLVPATINSRSFVIKSWTNSGFPNCEVTKINVLPPIRLEFLLSMRKNILEQMKDFQSRKISKADCTKMSKAYDSTNYSQLANALKLSEPLPTSPFIEYSSH
jgi:hypothetical protein